jgi:hypothetical protein
MANVVQYWVGVDQPVVPGDEGRAGQQTLALSGQFPDASTTPPRVGDRPRARGER